MDERSHWDKIAPSYNEEIFDVFKSDKEKKLHRFFSKHANLRHSAIDFGCGTGKALPFLSPIFKNVVAVDISKECLTTASKRPYKNIQFLRKDLSAPNVRLTPAEFVFCCNVIMLPEVKKNLMMFRNVTRSLRPKGTALLIVPSSESMLFAAWRMIDWYRKDGVLPENITMDELAYFNGRKTDLLQGIFKIDGVPTKHYSESELEVLFKQAGLRVTALEKLTYAWNTEFASPPSWMKQPYPWDWIIECKKISATG